MRLNKLCHLATLVAAAATAELVLTKELFQQRKNFSSVRRAGGRKMRFLSSLLFLLP
jgi:hypothetical protein